MNRAPAAVAALLVAACAPGPPAPSPLPAPATPESVATATPRPTVVNAPPTRPSIAPTAPSDAPLSGEALAVLVDAEAIRRHLVELQRIAEAHGGNRAAGTPGFDASADYVGDRLEAAGYVVVRQRFTFPFTDPASGVTDERSSVNLIAERPGTDGAEVLILGAHLDSVPVGPGINDNGSGSMTLLEVAEQLVALEPPQRTVRFAFWSAEEGGPFGSAAYVESLTPAERDRIVGYLNFDMLGSPNHVRFVYAEENAAPGSEALTGVFAAYFEGIGLAWEPIDLTGHADHGPFARAGIPTGGLFSGGSDDKTDAQAAAFGGTAGVPADPCSHRPCDTIANVSDVALGEMADALVHALVALAQDD